MSRLLLILALFVAAPIFDRPAAAQTVSPRTTVGASATSSGEPEEAVAADSPRAAMSRFLEFCRKGEFEAAAGYLETSWAARRRRDELARRLKAVLDRHDWLDPDSLSPGSAGDRTDGLGPGVDRVGRVPGGGEREEAVYIVRRPGTVEGWRFSAGTVRRVDGWYEGLGNRWAMEHLPEPLLRPGPWEILWWQWLALPFILVAAWAGAMLLGFLTRWGLGRITARTQTPWDDVMLRRLRGPIVLVWGLLAIYLLVPLLGLYDPAEAFVNRALRTFAFVTFFWAFLVAVDVGGRVVETWPWAKENPASRSLVLLGARVGKVAIVAMAVIAVLSELGYPVASLVAGLGIGGLAVALASQKTVEHMFGAVSLGVDQPFRVGDFVRVEDFVGTVEVVGLRSTRIRTLDRTLISIPNGKLSEMRVESFTARDRMRLNCTIGLVYDTTADQMRKVLDGLEAVLRDHPKIWPDAVVVRFKQFGVSSLDIEITAWFTTEWDEFLVIRQEVLLAFMDVVARAGTSFAFPTRTVHVVGQPAQI